MLVYKTNSFIFLAKTAKSFYKKPRKGRFRFLMRFLHEILLCHRT